jgi:hypothetical protein
MQIYLPDDLYAEVKTRKLPASELLQRAIRVEIQREDKLHAAAEFLAEVFNEFGEPSAEALAGAEEVWNRIKANLEPPVVEELEPSSGHGDSKAS